MNLIDKLASISSQDTIVELHKMLNHAQVSVNWYGQRMVKVEGLQNSVEINDIAKKFLDAELFKKDGTILQERLEGYMLWGRIQRLYIESDLELSKTNFYKYLTPIKEVRPYCRSCAGDPMAIIGEWEGNPNPLLGFTPEEFKSVWPNTQPDNKSFNTTGERWFATKKMLEMALANPGLPN